MIRRLLILPWMILIPLWLSCVDKVSLELAAVKLPIIVDGFVTVDNQHPDTVKLTVAYPADGKTYPPQWIVGAKMAITDDTGFVDSLVEIGKGNYITNALEGVVGRTYRLTIRLKDSETGEYTTISSTPQRLLDAGVIDTVYYEFTTRSNPDTDLPEDGFNIFVDATVSPNSSRQMLWEFFGTFTTTSDPAAITIEIPCAAPPCPREPLPCSINCECCVCWYTAAERSPIVSNPEVSTGQHLMRVFMQYIPINSVTFFDRYRVEISQIELSKEVFEYYKAIRKQADNSTSIFQPPFSEISGNITVESGTMSAIGTFAASTIARTHIYIPQNAVPYQLGTELRPGDCRGLADNATLIQPPYWQ